MADTPPVPPGQPAVPAGAPAVTDRRPVPRGVLPRGVQTWIMAGIALGMLAIMFVVGRPGPPARNAPAAAPEQGPSADRVRDYQERLRTLEAQALREAQAAAVAPSAPAARNEEPQSGRRHQIHWKQIGSGASTKACSPAIVVLSRRPESERPDAGRASVPASQASCGSMPATPSIDDIADAAARASARAAGVETIGARGTSPTECGGATGAEDSRGRARRPSERTPSALSGPCIGCSRERSSTPS